MAGASSASAFPLQYQQISTMIMFYPAPTDGRYSNGLRGWLFHYTICVWFFMYTSFYILVSLVSVLLRPTTSLLWLILSVPMCIDVTMCMLMYLFYDPCAMLALYVSVKFLLYRASMVVGGPKTSNWYSLSIGPYRAHHIMLHKIKILSIWLHATSN